jgi:hypothetical protein
LTIPSVEATDRAIVRMRSFIGFSAVEATCRSGARTILVVRDSGRKFIGCDHG